MSNNNLSVICSSWSLVHTELVFIVNILSAALFLILWDLFFQQKGPVFGTVDGQFWKRKISLIEFTRFISNIFQNSNFTCPFIQWGCLTLTSPELFQKPSDSTSLLQAKLAVSLAPSQSASLKGPPESKWQTSITKTDWNQSDDQCHVVYVVVTSLSSWLDVSWLQGEEKLLKAK